MLQKQIDKLQDKIRKEKQLNKQMEMNSELKKLKRELRELEQNECRTISKNSKYY